MRKVRGEECTLSKSAADMYIDPVLVETQPVVNRAGMSDMMAVRGTAWKWPLDPTIDQHTNHMSVACPAPATPATTTVNPIQDRDSHALLFHPDPSTPNRTRRIQNTMKLSLALLAATLGFVAAEDLGIEVTHAVECERKTQKGDNIEVHYRGTLASNGEKFDASTLVPCVLRLYPALSRANWWI